MGVVPAGGVLMTLLVVARTLSPTLRRKRTLVSAADPHARSMRPARPGMSAMRGVPCPCPCADAADVNALETAIINVAFAKVRIALS
jgi:hypothetical protein